MWHIVSDTSCDLHSLEGGEGVFDFATIPFTIRIGNKEYIDDENMPVEEMLTANESQSELAQTSCPSPEDWREKFAPEGPALAFTISSALSGSSLAPEFTLSYTVKDKEAARNELIGKAVSDSMAKAKNFSIPII